MSTSKQSPFTQATVSPGLGRGSGRARARRRPGKNERLRVRQVVDDSIPMQSWADAAEMDDTVRTDRKERNRGNPTSGLEDRIRAKHAAAVEAGAKQSLRFEPTRFPVVFDTGMSPTLPNEREEIYFDFIEFVNSLTDLLKTLAVDNTLAMARYVMPGDEDDNLKILLRDLLSAALFQLAQRLVVARGLLGLQKGSVSRITSYKVSTLRCFSNMVGIFGEFVDEQTSRLMHIPAYEATVKKLLSVADSVSAYPVAAMDISTWCDHLAGLAITLFFRQAPFSAGETDTVHPHACALRSRLLGVVTDRQRPVRRDFFSAPWTPIDNTGFDTEFKAYGLAMSYMFDGQFGLALAPTLNQRATWLNAVMANDPVDATVALVVPGFNLGLLNLPAALPVGWTWRTRLAWAERWQRDAGSLSRHLILTTVDESPQNYRLGLASMHVASTSGPFLIYKGVSVVGLDEASVVALLRAKVVATREATANTSTNMDVRKARVQLLRADVKVE